jgi:pimeloyl-ACP methyl ester carboxylesterase
LRGTLVAPPAGETAATVLVHGGGVTREEGGFFARLAARLAGAGSPTLRFDFRGHGESEGRQ